MKHFLAALALMSLTTPAVANPQATTIINEYRAEKRRAPLSYSDTLEKAAQAHARDMVAKGLFSHTGSDGSSVSVRVDRTGYSWCFVAENIAQGQTSLSQVMAGWKGSPGHYKNMTHKQAKEFALVRGAQNTWVMVLAAPC